MAEVSQRLAHRVPLCKLEIGTLLQVNATLHQDTGHYFGINTLAGRLEQCTTYTVICGYPIGMSGSLLLS